MEKKALKKEVLSLLVRNARISTQEIAIRLGASEGEVLATIAELEKERVIVGYTAIGYRGRHCEIATVGTSRPPHGQFHGVVCFRKHVICPAASLKMLSR